MNERIPRNVEKKIDIPSPKNKRIILNLINA